MKKRSNSLVKGFFIVLVALIGASSCNLFQASDTASGTDSTGVGELALFISPSAARMIEPGVDTTIASYDLTGTGPDSASFNVPGFESSTYSNNLLAIGTWEITVLGRNLDGEIIGAVTDTFEVRSGETTSITLTLRPITGTGVISITVSWPDGSLPEPSIVATVDRPDGILAQEVVFEEGLDGHSFVWEDADAATGYHTVLFEVFSGAESVTGGGDVIRVLNDTTTQFTFEYTAEQLAPYTAKPVLSLASGTYAYSEEGHTLEITCATPEVEIRYTTNGSIPDADNGFIYSGPIQVFSTQTLRAVALKEGRAASAIASGFYIINDSIAVPIFSHEPGVHYDPISVAIASSTPGAVIMYTLDGSTPTATTGELYSVPIPVAAETTIRAVATNAAHYAVSDLTEASFRITGHVEAPVFDLAEGIYQEEKTLVMTCSTPGSAIRYTLDGSIPGATTGTLYAGPIELTASHTVKAMSYRLDWEDSAVVSSIYTFKVSLPTTTIDTGTYFEDQTADLACSLVGSAIRYTTDGTVPSASIGNLYDTPVLIGRSTTIKAVASRDGWSDSDVLEKTYTLKCSIPSFDPLSGIYSDASIIVNMHSVTPETAIVSTVNGTDPVPNVNGAYGFTRTVSSELVIKTLAVKSGWSNSDIVTGTFTPGVTAVTPENSAAISESSTNLDWADRARAISYELQVELELGLVEAAEIIPCVESSYVMEGPLAIGDTRYWRYRAVYDDDSRGEWSSMYSFTIGLAPPVLLAPFDDSFTTTRRPEFSWEVVTDAALYEITLAQSLEDLPSASPSALGGTSWTPDNDLEFGTWFWRVRAMGSDGTPGEWSESRALSIFYYPIISFEDGLIPTDFTHSGSALWYVVSGDAASGSFSIRSGAIGHSQSTTLSLSGTVQSGTRITGIRFDRKVSSESGCDYLQFYNGGSSLGAWAGTYAWGTVSYAFIVDGGSAFTFSWVYSKDYSVVSGSDCAWVDDIEILFEAE